MKAPLAIWAVSDGRAGIENQVLGLAEAVARLTPAVVETRRVAYRDGVGALPAWLNVSPRRALLEPLGAPWPDLWIAAGRATLPLSIRVRRWSNGRTFVVQVQAPRWPLRLFDLVVPPRHDGVAGPNVFPITGSPHRVTPERLAEAAAAFRDRLDRLPRPRVAVLIGGRSSAFDLTPARADALGREIVDAVAGAGGSVLATFSRRTPEAARAVLAERLRAVPGWVWDGEGDNPLFAFLADADHVLVTEDSANMTVEAAATGKPVHRLALNGGSPKFARLHAELDRHGGTRAFDGTLPTWTYEPLRETERAAAAVVAALGARDRSAPRP